MADVRLIAAVGRSGQIGLRGGLPWVDRDDLARFKMLTWGDVIVVGRRTAKGLGPLPTRTVHVFDRECDTPEAVLGSFSNRVVWIAGGAYVYRLFARFVTEFVIRRIDYDGPADTWFPGECLPGCEKALAAAHEQGERMRRGLL